MESAHIPHLVWEGGIATQSRAAEALRLQVVREEEKATKRTARVHRLQNPLADPNTDSTCPRSGFLVIWFPFLIFC